MVASILGGAEKGKQGAAYGVVVRGWGIRVAGEGAKSGFTMGVRRQTWVSLKFGVVVRG